MLQGPYGITVVILHRELSLPSISSFPLGVIHGLLRGQAKIVFQGDLDLRKILSQDRMRGSPAIPFHVLLQQHMQKSFRLG